VSRRASDPEKWRHAGFMTNSVKYLTADELNAMMEEIVTIFDRYAERDDKAKRPDGARPVRLYAHGHPLPPTPSGN
jgi:hypothetical protein